MNMCICIYIQEASTTWRTVRFLMRVHSRWLVAICERTNIYI